MPLFGLRWCAACHHRSLSHLGVWHCVHLGVWETTPRISRARVATTSPRTVTDKTTCFEFSHRSCCETRTQSQISVQVFWRPVLVQQGAGGCTTRDAPSRPRQKPRGERDWGSGAQGIWRCGRLTVPCDTAESFAELMYRALRTKYPKAGGTTRGPCLDWWLVSCIMTMVFRVWLVAYTKLTTQHRQRQARRDQYATNQDIMKDSHWDEHEGNRCICWCWFVRGHSGRGGDIFWDAGEVVQEASFVVVETSLTAMR